MINRLKEIECEKEREKITNRIARHKAKYPEEMHQKYLTRIEKEFNNQQKINDILDEIKPLVKDEVLLSYVQSELKRKSYIKSYDGDKELIKRLKNYFEKKEEARFKIINDDFRKIDLKDKVDCIITDPPYPKEYLPLYKDLALHAVNVLKPGGSMFIMVGQSYLPELFNLLKSEGLHYNWTLCYLTPGGQSPQIWQRKVNTFWKPVLWFTKGKPTFWIGDVVKSKVNDNDKDHHHWGQSVSGMNDLVKRVTFIGDVVYDPFMGAGTTGVACIENNRKFIGADIVNRFCRVAEERLNNVFI